MIRNCIICEEHFDTGNRTKNKITCSAVCGRERKLITNRRIHCIKTIKCVVCSTLFTVSGRSTTAKYCSLKCRKFNKLDQQKVRYRNNPEVFRQRRKEYYRKHSEYCREYSKQYAKENREKCYNANRQWRLSHREYLSEIRRQTFARKKAALELVKQLEANSIGALLT